MKKWLVRFIFFYALVCYMHIGSTTMKEDPIFGLGDDGIPNWINYIDDVLQGEQPFPFTR